MRQRPARSRGLRCAYRGRGAAAAAAIALATPPLWTTHRPRWLPWYLESYINGVHIYDKPQPWLFPLFPWSAFAFAGLGDRLLVALSVGAPPRARGGCPLRSGVARALSRSASGWTRGPSSFYAVYDFWHTSPNFFLVRVGVSWDRFLSYAWCRWGAGQWGFSPMIEIGQAFAAGLLGAHRIRLRPLFDSDKGAQGIAQRDAGASDDFRRDDRAGHDSQPHQGPRPAGAGSLAAARSGRGADLGR